MDQTQVSTYTVTATQRLFDTRGGTIHCAEIGKTFQCGGHVRVNGQISELTATLSHTAQLTHARALLLEQDGYKLTPSPAATERAEWAARTAADTTAAATAAAKAVAAHDAAVKVAEDTLSPSPATPATSASPDAKSKK
jgi:hypothetical protein